MFPSYRDVAQYRARDRDGGGEGVGDTNGEDGVAGLENSRLAAVNQIGREAMELAKSAKEVKRQKAFHQRADLDNRRQQFGSGNLVTFILDPQTGGRPRDIYALEISKLLTHAGFKKEEIIGIKKNEWRSTQIEVSLKDGVSFDCEKIEKEIREKAKLGYSVSKFAYSEDTFKIKGIPFHKDQDLVRDLIKEAVSPFVKEIVSVEPGRYFEEKLTFFHGKENGEWKVKVVARAGVLVPNFIIVGKISKVVAQVVYTKISSSKRQDEVCYDCYKVGHKKLTQDCDGSILVTEFAKVFEDDWQKNYAEKGVEVEGNIEEDRDMRKIQQTECLVKLQQEMEAKEKEFQEKISENENMQKESLVKLQQDLDTKEKENEMLRETQENDKQALEGVGRRTLEMHNAMNNFKEQVEELQRENVSQKGMGVANVECIENLRKMHGDMINENNKLKQKVKDGDLKLSNLQDRLDVLSTEKDDQLSGQIEAFCEMQLEVETMAQSIELVSKAENEKDGVHNSVPYKTSVSSLELSFQDLEQGEDGDRATEEEDETVAKEVVENVESDLKEFQEDQNDEVSEVTLLEEDDVENKDGSKEVEKSLDENEVLNMDDGGEEVSVGLDLVDHGGHSKVVEKEGGKRRKKSNKRWLSPEMELISGKKIKARQWPRENSMIFYLRGGKFVLAKVKQKVYKDRQKKWYNVHHLDPRIEDDCINLENPEEWHYPEEDCESTELRRRSASTPPLGEGDEGGPSILVTLFQDDNLDDCPDDVESDALRVRAVSHGDGKSANEGLLLSQESGSPELRLGPMSSSPVMDSENCEREMEKNIVQFMSGSDIGEVDVSLNVNLARSPTAGSRFLDVSQANKTPFKKNTGFSVSDGSDLDI